MTKLKSGFAVVLLYAPRPKQGLNFPEEDGLKAVHHCLPHVPLSHLGWDESSGTMKPDHDSTGGKCLQRVSAARPDELARLAALAASGEPTPGTPLVIAVEGEMAFSVLRDSCVRHARPFAVAVGCWEETDKRG